MFYLYLTCNQVQFYNVALLLCSPLGSLTKTGVSAGMGLPSKRKIEPDRRLHSIYFYRMIAELRAHPESAIMHRNEERIILIIVSVQISINIIVNLKCIRLRLPITFSLLSVYHI